MTDRTIPPSSAPQGNAFANGLTSANMFNTSLPRAPFQTASRTPTVTTPSATAQSRLNDFYAKMKAPSGYAPQAMPPAATNSVPNMPGPSPFLGASSMPLPNPMRPTPPPVAPFMASKFGE